MLTCKCSHVNVNWLTCYADFTSVVLCKCQNFHLIVFKCLLCELVVANIKHVKILALLIFRLPIPSSSRFTNKVTNKAESAKVCQFIFFIWLYSFARTTLKFIVFINLILIIIMVIKINCLINWRSSRMNEQRVGKIIMHWNWARCLW